MPSYTVLLSTVRVTPQQYDKIYKTAKEHNLKPTEVIRRAIDLMDESDFSLEAKIIRLEERLNLNIREILDRADEMFNKLERSEHGKTN